MSDDSIFPRFESWENEKSVTLTDAVAGGLTKREWFAAMALGPVMATFGTDDLAGLSWGEYYAGEAVKMADQLIAALAREEP